MNVGCSVIARISASTISTLSVPMPVETAETRGPRYVPVRDANSRWRCSRSMESKRDGDPLDAVLVAGEEDVVGQLARAEPDVVLPLTGGDCDAGIRVRQGPCSCSLTHECA